MKITSDENILLASEAFSSLGSVELLPGRKINRSALKNTEALIVRSVTKVNKSLLSGTEVKFVGTATIGDDHIDKDFLSKNRIGFSNAKGCNAQAVAEYVFSAIAHIAVANGLTLSGKSIGVIGVGNIGSRVVRLAEALGMKVIKNDPPLQNESGNNEFRTLEEVLKADIITLHVPLNIGGKYNTFHLLNECNLNLFKPNSVLINASRGAVIDNAALKKRLLKNKNIFTVLDVWENEPDIDLELLKSVDIATPHIAGYSYEGKVNGTAMIYKALCNYLGTTPKWNAPQIEIENNTVKLTLNTLEEQLHELFSVVYPILEDDIRTRALLKTDEQGKLFDKLRKEYPLRRELKGYEITGARSAELRRFLKTINSI